MTQNLHSRILWATLSLYFISTWTSMAGMEIFGWLTFALAISYVARGKTSVTFRRIGEVLPWKACLALLIWTAIGLWMNQTDKTEFVQHFGSQRWMFLLFSSSIAIAIHPPTPKGYRVFLGITSIIAVYAIFQSITGIDLLRPGEHRAVQPTGIPGSSLWRSAGLFGSPLGYGYIAGQYVCLALATTLILAHRRLYSGVFWASLAAYVVISMSLISTFTRGVWIAMVISHLAIAFLAARRLAIGFFATTAAVAAVAFTFVEPLRWRLQTVIDPNYYSNSERVFLWLINWEMFKDYPILGIGYQENENRAREYATRLGHPDAFTGHAHNNYLQMLSGTGAVGLVLYLFIIGFMLVLTLKVWRAIPENQWWPRALVLGSLGAQLTLHIGGFTECNFKAGATSHNLMMTWAVIAAMAVIHGNAFPSKRGA